MTPPYPDSPPNAFTPPQRRSATRNGVTTMKIGPAIIVEILIIETIRGAASAGMGRPEAARRAMTSCAAPSQSSFDLTRKLELIPTTRKITRGSHHVGRATRLRKVSEGRENVPTTADMGEIGASAAGTAGDALLTCSAFPRRGTRPSRRPAPRGPRG